MRHADSRQPTADRICCADLAQRQRQYWYDRGRRAGYREAIEDLLDGRDAVSLIIEREFYRKVAAELTGDAASDAITALAGYEFAVIRQETPSKSKLKKARRDSIAVVTAQSELAVSVRTPASDLAAHDAGVSERTVRRALRLAGVPTQRRPAKNCP